MTPEAARAAAEILMSARGDHRRLTAFPEDCRPQDLDDGYAIQNALEELWGLDVAGWKIGATAQPTREMLKVDTPFAGRIYAPFVMETPAEVASSAFLFHAVESEIALRLGADLPARDAAYGEDEVAASVETAHPAFELVNHYWTDIMTTGAPNIVADNGSNGGLVLGAGRADWRDLGLEGIEAVLTIDGVEKGRGPGSLAHGGPVRSLTWLVNEMSARGIGLRAGQYISTGTLTGMNPCAAGQTAVADFGPLGRVQVTYTE